MAEETQIEVPLGRRHIIERPRLTRLLDETTARVIMLVAPAGYGKTTLARQWVANRPHGWYSAGAASADVAALALGLMTATQGLRPNAGRRLREWLPTSREPASEIDVIAQLIEQELSEWPEDAWLVLDDYHLVSSRASEELLEKLFAKSSYRVLLTSRRRPRWVRARERLYGSVLEVTESSLAMSAEEASAVLAGQDDQAVGGLVALANGWPAVIGLAALTPAQVPDRLIPNALHDFLAEEIFSALRPYIQKGLTRLALLPRITRQIAQDTLGPNAEAILQKGVSAGILELSASGGYFIHPLLRHFLEEKLVEDRSELNAAVTPAAQALIRAEMWDDAFSLISRFCRPDLLDEILAGALITLVREGRVATVTEWLEFASVQGYESPYIDLADSELAFRSGRYERAEALARAATASLPGDHPLCSLGHLRAGQARSFMDDGWGALEHFKAAYETAQNSFDARNALWGQFVVASEIELPDAAVFLERLAAEGKRDSDAIVREACGHFALALLEGHLPDAIEELESAGELIERVRDPLIRASFWRSYASALVLHAEYRRALDLLERALCEAETFHLKFVRPHALVSSAAARIGLRQFTSADREIEEIEQAAEQMRDQYLIVNARILRCRSLLHQGAPEAALAATAGVSSTGPSPTRRVELLAISSAAMACAGDPLRALDVVRRADSLTRGIEPRLLAQWTEVICEAMLGRVDEQEIERSYARTVSDGALDTLVFAYRLHPAILSTLGQNSAHNEHLSQLLFEANDQTLARRNGLVRLAVPQKRQVLTPREAQVYELLGEGRSNSEIARALFISEKTAKVHVRNVLRKLGVQNRTQAAILASRDDDPVSRS
jgi:LuxR family maltose regulon positive regulatory protein